MGYGSTRRSIFLLIGFILCGIGVLLAFHIPTASANDLPPGTPGPGAMTVYTVTNPNSFALNVEQVITNTVGFNDTFWTQIPPNASVTYHLRDNSQVSDPFQGTLSLYADHPFTAQVTGYDNLPPTGTPSPTATVGAGVQVPTGSMSARVWIPYAAKPSAP